MAFISKGGGFGPKRKRKYPPGWGTAPVNGVPQFGRATSGAGTMLLPRGGLFGPLGGRGGGSDPYAGLIGGQPDLSGYEAAMAAAGRDDAASRDAALRRFIISYGAAPDFSNMSMSDQARGFLKGALDPKTLELARKAEEEGLSIHARQAKENMIANRRIPATLAGRGLLRSGQTGYDLGEQAQNYKITQYDTLNELLGSIEGTVGNYLSAERERQLGLAMARMQAAQDAYGGWQDADVGGSSVGSGSSIYKPPGISFSGSQPKLGMARPNRAGRPWRNFTKAPGQRNRH